MAFKFNVFTGNFDITEGGSAYWLDAVTDEASLPDGGADGAARTVQDQNTIYLRDEGTGTWYRQLVTLGNVEAASTPKGISITEVTTGEIVTFEVRLHPADGTNAGIVSTTTQTFAGDKTFANNVVVTGNLTVNGTTTNISTVDLLVEDKLITINDGGAAASGGGAGLEVEEDSVITGYIKTSADRTSWEIKSLDSAGIISINPQGNSFNIQGQATSPSGNSIDSINSANQAGIFTQNAAGNTSNIRIETGDSTTGNSGNVILRAGLANSGTRGRIATFGRELVVSDTTSSANGIRITPSDANLLAPFTGDSSIQAQDDGKNLIIYTAGATNVSGALWLVTGPGGTGSGNIVLNTWDQVGRGDVEIFANNVSMGLTGNLTLNNSSRLVSLVDPIDAQDAATKNYVDSNFANRTLSNLTSPTAINQTLFPSGPRALGGPLNTQRWTNLYINGQVNIGPNDTITELQIINSTIQAGNAQSLNLWGSFNAAGTGGNTDIRSGSAGANFDSGTVNIRSVDASGTGSSGATNLFTGNVEEGASGSINLSTGGVSAGTSSSGDITLFTGAITGTGTGARGIINLHASTVDMSNSDLINLGSPIISNVTPNAANSFDLGDNTNRWRNTYALNSYADNFYVRTGTTNYTRTYFNLIEFQTAGGGSPKIYSQNSASATASLPVTIATGNNSSTGNTGNLFLQTGTIVSGIRGYVQIDASALTVNTTGIITFNNPGSSTRFYSAPIPFGGAVDIGTTASKWTNAYVQNYYAGTNAEALFAVDQTTPSAATANTVGSIALGDNFGVVTANRTGGQQSGAIYIETGTSDGGVTGDINISSGTTSTPANRGDINLESNSITLDVDGSINVAETGTTLGQLIPSATGTALPTGNLAQVLLRATDAGDVLGIATAQGLDSSTSGNIRLETGFGGATNGSSGDIFFRTGNATGTGVRGTVAALTDKFVVHSSSKNSGVLIQHSDPNTTPANQPSISTQNAGVNLVLYTAPAPGSTSGTVVIASGDGATSGDVVLYAWPSATRGEVRFEGSQVNANSTNVVNVLDPVNAQDAATKNYVDTQGFKAPNTIYVGSAAQVTAGTADQSTITAAIAAAAGGDKIIVLPSYAGEASVDVNVNNITVEGYGRGTVLTGTLTISASRCLVRQLGITGNITLSGDNNFLNDSWQKDTATVTVTGTGNLYTLIADSTL